MTRAAASMSEVHLQFIGCKAHCGQGVVAALPQFAQSIKNEVLEFGNGAGKKSRQILRRHREALGVMFYSTRSKLPFASMAFALGALAACSAEPDAAHAHHAEGLDVTSQPSHFCVDPPLTTPSIADQLAVPTTIEPLGDSLASNGLQVQFAVPPAPARDNVLEVRFPLDREDPDGRLESFEATYAGQRIRVQTGRALRAPTGLLVLSTGGAPLRSMELSVTYQTRQIRGTNNFAATDFALHSVSSGAQAAHGAGAGSYAATPGNCIEEGILRFGPFPAGMPPVKWPIFNGCNWSKCSDAALGWLEVHHNVWRASQMIAVLDGMHPAQRSFFWGRPGRDANDDPVSLRSSPEHWYGTFDGDRYDAIREVVQDFRGIMNKAETGGIDIRLSCPSYGSNPGNVCFNSQAMAHHWVKGWVNLCDSAFTDTNCNADNVGDGVARSLHHEPLHHVFTHLNGVKALMDTKSHWHGNACLSSPITAPMYCETENAPNNISHFVAAGNACGHLDKLATSIDAHALFIQTIGDMVRDGTMTHWPAITPATPTPPACYGDPNCLCDSTDPWTAPDGDYSITKQCPDNQGLSVCMKTTFNASDTVGICTLCDEHRGPGCPCNDLSNPCESGFCFGDDTQGNASATGICYQANPPSWACLADCEMLLGNGAFCMNDHPGGGRCVPVATATNEAHNCWNAGGHMDPQALSCSFQPECVSTPDCHNLGYPSYFACDGTNRCIAQP